MTGPTTEAQSVVIERDLPFQPDRIWRALTQPHLIAEWLLENDFAPVAGHRFSLRVAPQPHWDGVIDCAVRIVEPHRTLSYSWAALGLDSVVTWTLTPIPAGTRLRMEQVGFRPDQKQAYAGAQYGWQKYLAALEQLLKRED
jgi:uncharacterized protein YndB with AHSA1/START domain